MLGRAATMPVPRFYIRVWKPCGHALHVVNKTIGNHNLFPLFRL
jgi:hypothetical protein